jgi:hypothetical protein
MPQPFVPTLNFHALNLHDLLEAREAYHVHLSHLDNVIATAVGYYRVRTSEIKQVGEKKASLLKPPAPRAEPRTLANSQVVPGYSWPCVMVFVRSWQKPDDFRTAPDEVVPRRLYLPDGRMIPVCVIVAEAGEEALSPVVPRSYPTSYAGGGFPLLCTVQGRTRLGSAGCLVSDGRETFVLTNRHVAGKPGDVAVTMLRGREMPVGRAVETRAGKVAFKVAFPGWPGKQSLCNLDAGLVLLDDLSRWTAQVYGIGEIGEPVDLNTETLSLALVGTPVKAFGAASGALEGEIQALFYRYKSIGGFDYISDLLIGPRLGADSFPSKHGDSGTLWFYDPPPEQLELESTRHEPGTGAKAPRLRPLALQWGGHSMLGQTREESINYVLASCVSTVCRVLDVELIRDLNVGLPETWGEVGHFEIGAKALDLPKDDNLRELLRLNLKNIARTDQDISEGHLGAKRGQFVPLADVPDLVWRNTRKADENNHFADMDRAAPSGRFEGKDLLALCDGQPENVDPKVWLEFYDSLTDPSPETGKPEKPGSLPFRVWQLFDAMVEAVKAGELAKFICAGGVLSHYVGDACQPLHVSRLHHGHSPDESAVHSDYETRMLDNSDVQDDLFKQINKALGPSKGAVEGDIADGHGAAVAVVELMTETIRKLDPEDVIASWDEHRGQGRFQAMWDDLGKRTVERMAAGCTLLARLWQSAWEAGQGRRVKPDAIDAIKERDLMDLYNDPTFVPSMNLQKMLDAGIFGGSAAGNGASPNGSDGVERKPRRSTRSRRRHT